MKKVKKEMSKRVKAKRIVAGEIKKTREGIVDYHIVKGKIIPRELTECEKLLKKWGGCVEEGVRIRCDIVPQRGPIWNHDERALFIVTVTNKTGYFRLEDVTVHLLSVRSKEGKANVDREHCSPNVVRLPYIRPGGSASTQNPVASWCDGYRQTPARRGFTLLCKPRPPNWTTSFLGTDHVVASALVTYRAVPYFEGRCTSVEPIIGT